MKKYIVIISLTFAIAFSAHSQKVVMSKPQITELIMALSDSVGRVYVDERKAGELKNKLRTNLESHAYDNETDPAQLARRLSLELIEWSDDEHFNVSYTPAGSRPSMMGTMTPNPTHLAVYNYFFKRLEILPGNVGLLELEQFVPVELAAPLIVSAMTFLSNADALIIDLRNCRGGDPLSVVHIASYFFKEPVLLHTSYVRSANVTNEFWTPKIEWSARSVGTSPFDRTNERKIEANYAKLQNVPIYALTSNFTFSSAELFAFSLQIQKRLQVVGETTGGGGHGIRPFALSNGYRVTIPFVKGINPVTKGNWEKVGVTPDIACPATDALKVAHENALTNLLKASADPLITRRLMWEKEQVPALYDPWLPTAEELSGFAGKYEGREIIFENNTLYSLPRGGNKKVLKPLRKDEFIVNHVTRFRFLRDDKNEVVGIEVLSMERDPVMQKKIA
jgi:retinol-binding protein 3